MICMKSGAQLEQTDQIVSFFVLFRFALKPGGLAPQGLQAFPLQFLSLFVLRLHICFLMPIRGGMGIAASAAGNGQRIQRFILTRFCRENGQKYAYIFCGCVEIYKRKADKADRRRHSGCAAHARSDAARRSDGLRHHRLWLSRHGQRGVGGNEVPAGARCLPRPRQSLWRSGKSPVADNSSRSAARSLMGKPLRQNRSFRV